MPPGAWDAQTMSTVVTSTPAEGVTLITLNRPEKLNAMSAELVEELHQALLAAGSDRACRAIVLTGAGRGFCAGLDLGGYGAAPDSEGRGDRKSTRLNSSH